MEITFDLGPHSSVGEWISLSLNETFWQSRSNGLSDEKIQGPASACLNYYWMQLGLSP